MYSNFHHHPTIGTSLISRKPLRSISLHHHCPAAYSRVGFQCFALYFPILTSASRCATTCDHFEHSIGDRVIPSITEIGFSTLPPNPLLRLKFDFSSHTTISHTGISPREWSRVAAMSSLDLDDESASAAKRRKIQRACDYCRRKKSTPSYDFLIAMKLTCSRS